MDWRGVHEIVVSVFVDETPIKMKLKSESRMGISERNTMCATLRYTCYESLMCRLATDKAATCSLKPIPPSTIVLH